MPLAARPVRTHLPWCLALLGALLTADVTGARTFVLHPDGSGDVPTFQAGMDSLVREESRDDTLVVMPGVYEEDVRVDGSRSAHFFVLCPAGHSRTQLRSLTLVWCGIAFVRGLHLLRYEKGFPLTSTFEECRFSTFSYFAGDLPPRIRRCLLNGEVRMDSNHGTLVFEANSFMKANVLVTPTEDPIEFHGCVFKQSVVSVPQSIYGVTFADCLFADMDQGIMLKGGGTDLSVVRTTFRDIKGAAISSPGAVDLTVTDSRFERCGRGIDLLGSRLQLERDTLRTIAGSGIDMDFVIGVPGPSLTHLVVQRCGGDGIRIDNVRHHLVIDSSSVRECGGNAIRLGQSESGSVSVRNSLLTDNAGPAIELAIRRGSITGNTAVANGGDGIHVSAPPGASIDDLAVIGNIVAGNGGVGIAVQGPYLGRVEHNDAWMNASGSYAGLSHGETNLELDPRFCGVAVDDFRLAASSPCAPAGPFGQIGALPVGCDVMSVPVDLNPGEHQPVNPRSNAPVDAAILGHRLFDARRVDAGTVRLAGASPGSSFLTDVNRDGLTDLLMAFRARDLDLASGGRVELAGSTVDGVPFVGSDSVEIRRAPGRAPGISGSSEDVPGFWIKAACPCTAKEIRATLSLSGTSPAWLELFDVSGRRITRRDLEGLSSGVHEIGLEAPSASGVHWLRLSQEGRTTALRILLVH